jgi:predicted secreted protein
MNKFIKGRDVNLFLGDEFVAGSTSCSITLTPNTTDSASKSDPGGGMWDNPEFANCSWSISNESFAVSADQLSALLSTVVNGDATVSVRIQDGISLSLAGAAIITQLQINAAAGENATISLSLDGASTLTLQEDFVDSVYEKISPIKGKALMLAINQGGTYHTLAASTSHSLSVSAQTADIITKDENDKGLVKEVTGKSISLSTECLMMTDNFNVYAQAGQMAERALNGMPVTLVFGYYPDSMGKGVSSDINWKTPTKVLLEGSFLCTSFSMNGAVKENATYSAEFSGVGMPTVTSTSAAAEGGEA